LEHTEEMVMNPFENIAVVLMLMLGLMLDRWK
jgi:hypothetical protein